MCLSVHWSVGYDYESCKNGLTNQDAVSGADSGSPKEPWGQTPPHSRAFLRMMMLGFPHAGEQYPQWPKCWDIPAQC